MATGACPRCQHESMYENPNPYHIGQTMKMHEHCSHCGLKYKIEPNFFFGAMYVSYALAVAAGVASFVVAHWGFGLDLPQSFWVIFGVLAVLMPLIARLSRNIYIHFFVSYDPAYAQKAI